MREKKRPIPIIDDWYIATQDNSLNKRECNILISNSMISNPNLMLPKEIDSYQNEYSFMVVVGKLGVKKIVTSGICKIEAGIAFTADEMEYQLGNMNSDYRNFLVMVNKNTPILYNYVIGYKNGKFYIVGNIYENKDIYTIEDEVIAQDMEKFLITLSCGKTVFVNWLSMNESLEFNLKYQILRRTNRVIKYSNTLFCGKKCVLDIFNTEWEFDFNDVPEVFELPKLYPVLK